MSNLALGLAGQVRALAGYRVVDLAGPMGWYGTKLLADLGADVVRVEPPGGDPERNRPPLYRGRPGTSLSYRFYNTSKQSIILDRATAGGQAAFDRLVAEADIVFDTGDKNIPDHPALIRATVTPFGRSGPKAAWQAPDLIAMAAGGVAFLNGYPDKPPLLPPGEQAYNLGGAAATVGVLIALQHRHRTGQGQQVDVSIQEAVATAIENTLGFWDILGTIRQRMGAYGFQGFEVLLRCLDGWVMGIHGNRWESLLAWAEAIGIADEAWRDPRWLDRDERDTHQDVINGFVNRLIAAQTKREVAERAVTYRIALQPVQEIADLLADPQLAHRGFWVPVADPDLGAVLTFPGAPYQSSAGGWGLRRAPLPGEHTEQVLAELSVDSQAVPVFVGRASLPDSSHPVLSDSVVKETRRRIGQGRPTYKDGDGPQPHLSGTAARPTRTGAVGGGALAGIRVLDFTQSVTGPLATRILAEHGAEVIKVEWGRRPDGVRLTPVPRPLGNRSPNVSGTFNNYNGGKRDVTLRMPLARPIVERLVSISDIVVDNYGVDPMPGWGLTYDAIRAIRPDCIVARSSVMGRTGPANGTVGFGYGIAAVAGWNSLMGFPGDPPVGMGPAYPDTTVNCHHLLTAILVALEHRRQTGQGQFIDLSQYESTIGWIGPLVLDHLVNGPVAPSANRHPGYAPHGIYPAAGDDRWIAIAVDDHSWPAFQTLSGIDGAAALADRKAEEDDLDARVAGWTGTQDAEALAEQLQAAGVAASAVADGSMLVSDPQLVHRSHYLHLDHPEAGRRIHERHAFQLGATPARIQRSPLLGEDNDWLLEELLGWSADEVAEAYVGGVVE